MLHFPLEHPLGRGWAVASCAKLCTMRPFRYSPATSQKAALEGTLDRTFAISIPNHCMSGNRTYSRPFTAPRVWCPPKEQLQRQIVTRHPSSLQFWISLGFRWVILHICCHLSRCLWWWWCSSQCCQRTGTLLALGARSRRGRSPHRGRQVLCCLPW